MGLEGLTDARASSVIGIDISTKAVAFSVFRRGELIHHGKVYLDGESIYDRCGDANRKMYHIFKMYEPEVVVIEATVFVNNRQVVKKLAHVVGAVGGVASALGAHVDEVSPISWQSFIGNPNLKADEKKKIKKDNPDANPAKLKKVGREFRKQRTMSIILEKYKVTIDDDDVADAVGVGWWGSEQYG